jgi:uncharacterized protein YjbI with pentapeptide repeats
MSNEDEASKPQPKDKLRFNQQQYELLKRCSDKKDMTEWNEWRVKHPNEEIRLQSAKLQKAQLANADLRYAHLEKVDLDYAHLANVNLTEAQLELALLAHANLENANLLDANLKCAYLVDANLESAFLMYSHLEYANIEHAHLANANLMNANLENANLMNANMKNSVFTCANLEHTSLSNSNLENVKFMEANLRGARFWKSKLQGADFSRAIIDGETLFSEYCEVDRNTKFEAVALGNLRIYPKTRQLLEYNIRRMNWKEWYKEHFLLQWPVKLFWSFSDYGISTWRIIGWFFLLALAFAAIYANCAYWWSPGIVNNLDVEPHLPLWHYFLLVVLRPVYFSIVTMTTLGFGDMHANEASILGHALLTLQVILGYVLLGALVTRFAVLFTAGGPAGKFSPIKTKEKSEGE